MTEIEKLRAALAWYADKENYRRVSAGESYRSRPPRAAVEDDGGARAIAALSGS